MRMRGRDSKGVWDGHVHTAIFKSEVKLKVTQSCLTLCDPMNYSPWNSLGQNAGVGSGSLLQGIFPTQGSNPGLALQVDSLPAEPQITKWTYRKLLHVTLKPECEGSLGGGWIHVDV